MKIDFNKLWVVLNSGENTNLPSHAFVGADAKVRAKTEAERLNAEPQPTWAAGKFTYRAMPFEEAMLIVRQDYHRAHSSGQA